MQAFDDDDWENAELDAESFRICHIFEEGLRSGNARPIEDLLKETRVTNRSTLLSNLVMRELQYRFEHGERPKLEEYYRRFPNDVDVIRPLRRFVERICAELGLPPVDSSDEHIPIRHVREYTILREIGSGGFGIVWEAWDETLQRRVAIKQIDRNHISKHDFDMAKREAQIAAQLNHPHIVQTYTYFEEDDGLYLINEYVDGPDLHSLLKSGGHLDPSTATEYCRQVAEALAYAHKQNVIHRDIKPSNILIDSQGHAKICDFGVARWQKADHTLSNKDGEVLIGTAGYISPEQAAGMDISGTSDVYSLGLVLYEMLTGAPPFTGSQRALLIAHQVHSIPSPRVRRPELHRDLETICGKAVEKKSNQRYPSAAALAEDLRLHGAGHPILAKPTTQLQRAWRVVKQRPASSVSVMLSLAVCGAMFPVAMSMPTANNKVNVTISTEPAGAELLITPVDAETGMRTKVTPFKTPTLSPGTIPLEPGRYWIQTVKNGVMNEFLRIVPENIHELPRAWKFDSWEVVGDNSISWPTMSLREHLKLPDMVFIPGAFNFPVLRYRDNLGNEQVIRQAITPFYLAKSEFTVRQFVDFAGRLPLQQNDPAGLDAPLGARFDQAVQWTEAVGGRLPTEFEFDYVCTLLAMHRAGDYELIDQLLAPIPMTRAELISNLEQIENLHNGPAEWVLSERDLYPASSLDANEAEFPEHSHHWKVLKGGHVDFDPTRPEDFADVPLGYRFRQRYFLIRPGGGFRLLCPASAANEPALAAFARTE